MSPAVSTEPPSGALAPQRHPDAPAPGVRLESHYAHCFGCGPRHSTGLHLRVTAGEGVSVAAELLVTPDHQGAPGLAHGGLLAAAVDEALGSLNWLLGRPAVTRRLETDFLRPVPVGSRLHLRAWCAAVDGRRAYLAAEGRLGPSEADPLAVRASAVFVQVPLAHFLAHGRREEVSAAMSDPGTRRSRETFDVNP